MSILCQRWGVKFSPEEIEKAKELQRLKKFTWTPQVGHTIAARHCPAGCREIAEGVHLIVETPSQDLEAIWLPSFDELLEVSRSLGVSFSMITDFIHRRRFADRAEREGLYTLLLERLR